jgi:predicted nucleotidyltransferase component of viral defense system
MIHTSRQLKALVSNMAKGDSAKSQTIIRNYVMERFLERLSLSPYRDRLILKGGVLVAALVGLNNRSTMDVDATVRNFALSEGSARKMVQEIIAFKIEDGMSFEIKSAATIMDEADYSGIRVMLDTRLDTMRTPLKIDFSTGDAITPGEVSFAFRLLFEERTISILAYNVETVLAEKMETLLSRGTANSRMRDFYDIFAINSAKSHTINPSVLRTAFANTSANRGSSDAVSDIDLILDEIEASRDLADLWGKYQRKFDYAADIGWNDVIRAVRELGDTVKS